MIIIDWMFEAINARKQIASLKKELANLRSYTNKMDGIAEQVIEWGNECAASNAYYKEVALRLKKDLEQERADKMALVKIVAKYKK